MWSSFLHVLLEVNLKFFVLFFFIPNLWVVVPGIIYEADHFIAVTWDTNFTATDFTLQLGLVWDFLSWSRGTPIFSRTGYHVVLLTRRSYSKLIFYRRGNRNREGQVSFANQGVAKSGLEAGSLNLRHSTFPLWLWLRGCSLLFSCLWQDWKI